MTSIQLDTSNHLTRRFRAGSRIRRGMCALLRRRFTNVAKKAPEKQDPGRRRGIGMTEASCRFRAGSRIPRGISTLWVPLSDVKYSSVISKVRFFRAGSRIRRGIGVTEASCGFRADDRG